MRDINSFPKIVLHDHLDGGLRPATVLALAAESGYEGLPHADETSLAGWFDQSQSGSLVDYLAAFDQTVAVMQTPEALRRTAREAVEDHAASGVVYAEIRFAPSLHQQRGMNRSEVIGAVVEGLAEGEAATGTVARVIIDAMRQDDDSPEVARAAAEFAGRGVVGFDLAGPEAGFPAAAHLPALRVAEEAGLRLTIHAGEADGPVSIADALDSGAERLGHGVRIVEDLDFGSGAMGPVARRVLEGGVALEVCPYSNVHTRAVPGATDHPARALLEAGYRVTLNTDNRLMSNTSMDAEFSLARDVLGFDDEDLWAVTANGLAAAFCDEETRERVRTEIDSRYAS